MVKVGVGGGVEAVGWGWGSTPAGRGSQEGAGWDMLMMAGGPCHTHVGNFSGTQKDRELG